MKIRCNNCYWIGLEEVFPITECPNCKTDEYLTDNFKTKPNMKTQPLFTSIAKIDNLKYQVRYYKGRTYYRRNFTSIIKAMAYALATFDVTRDEVLLSISL